MKRARYQITPNDQLELTGYIVTPLDGRGSPFQVYVEPGGTVLMYMGLGSRGQLTTEEQLEIELLHKRQVQARQATPPEALS